MNEAIWLPGIVVLVAGLLIGLALAIRLRGQGKEESKRQSVSPDLHLKIRDLEARRDDLYRRIRAAEEDELGPEEIAALEDAAAHTLRELDQLTEQMPAATSKKRTKDPQRVTDTDQTPEGAVDDESAPARARARNPLWVGFAFGATMVGVVGLLVYWAVKDAQPGPRMAPQSTQTDGAGQPPHEGQQEIPPEVVAQIADLQNRLVADPDDWLARKQLALIYVAAGQFFEAFSQASQILQQFPDDPDGLLVHGIVRLTMGQLDLAIDVLDQVLAQQPDHRQALIYRGLALYQTGKVEQAIDTWDMGIQILGGSDPELEELIRMAQSGASQPAGMPPTNRQPVAPSGQQPPQSPPSAAQEPDPNGFSLTIELSPGVQFAPQATLFVFLRPEEGEAPVAARRITLPRFPVEITLGSDDSMMGAELPASGTLVARLDTDGNVATTDASDLFAEISATKGQRVRLTLDR